MSRTLTAPRWGSRSAWVGILSLALAALAAICLAPQANAAFTTSKCEGVDITGRGASFARDAHTAFNFNFKNSYCIGTGGFGVRNVTYEPQGSGAGITAMTNRALPPRFGTTDDPPTASQTQQIEAGTTTPASDPNPNDNAEMHLVPSAVGAVALLVNFPNNCNADLLPQSARTDDKLNAADDALIRVRFTKAQLEAIWAQGAPASGSAPARPLVDWDEVITELQADTDCAVPVIRVVRFDHSGTTFAFKDYLDTIEPARGWLTTFAPSGGGQTREWPGATFGIRNTGPDACPDAANPGQFLSGPGTQENSADHLTSACANNAANLTTKLTNTDGSVGYADISTARNASTSLAVNPAGGDNDTYWTQVQNGSGTFTEPTADPNAFLTTTGTPAGPQPGANCLSATFTGIPGSTLADWSSASGVNSPAGYGICTLTYGMLFDDNADAWGNTPEEEAKARTVKDYWANIVSEGAQGQLFDKDYAPLPSTLAGGNPGGILAIARAGIDAIDWNKGAGGGGGSNGGNDNGGGGNNTTPPPPPPPPTNKFSLPRKTISSKTGGATISVKLPGPGKLVLIGTAKSGKKQVKVGQVVLNAGKAGTFALSLRPSGAALGLLRGKGSLPVSLKVTFTPTGGAASTMNSSVTLKLNRKKGK